MRQVLRPGRSTVGQRVTICYDSCSSFLLSEALIGSGLTGSKICNFSLENQKHLIWKKREVKPGGWSLMSNSRFVQAKRTQKLFHQALPMWGHLSPLVSIWRERRGPELMWSHFHTQCLSSQRLPKPTFLRRKALRLLACLFFFFFKTLA